MERLFCLELLLGKEKVERIKKAFVVVIGIGAAGSYATEALARYVRSRLRQRGIKEGIFCIYSDTPVSEEPLEKTRILNAEQDNDRGRQRHKLESTPTVTGASGLVAAHHALPYLTGDLKLI